MISEKGWPRLMLKAKRYIKYGLVFGLSIILGGLSSFFANYSNLTAKENSSRIIANSAKENELGTTTISFNFPYDRSSESFYNTYQISFDLRYMRVTPGAFDSYNGFFVQNKQFSESYSYSSSDIFEGGPFSLLVSPANSIIEQNGNYKHEIWDFSLMFDGKVTLNNDGTKTDNFCFITYSSATFYLQKKGIKYPSLNDYKNLLGNKISILFQDYKSNNSKNLTWTISNIIKPDDRSEYFEKRLGNFVACYVGLPTFEYPSFYLDFGHSLFMCGKYLKIISNLNLPDDISFSVLGKDPSLTDESFRVALESYLYSGYSNSVFVAGLLLVVLIYSICCVFILISTPLNFKLLLKFEVWILIVSSFLIWTIHLCVASFMSYDSLAFFIISCVPPFIGFLTALFIKKTKKKLSLPYDVIKI